MTISVLLVILYRKPFYFARGSEKKLDDQTKCGAAKRDDENPVIVAAAVKEDGV